eukprot:gb/GECH01002341.1/.p1 GENE.gb/GECH01002341.1/~~gb/GECH01002341.1/.p1  ORF type:complete len:514 (+),score=72.68 gb/GECH01002341.1/:1-1542(+)
MSVLFYHLLKFVSLNNSWSLFIFLKRIFYLIGLLLVTLTIFVSSEPVSAQEYDLNNEFDKESSTSLLFRQHVTHAPIVQQYIQRHYGHLINSDQVLQKSKKPVYFQPKENSQTRYVVFQSLDKLGLGNKLTGLISAFLLAVVTDRTLLVGNWNPVNIHDLFEFKFPVKHNKVSMSSAKQFNIYHDNDIERLLCDDLRNIEQHVISVQSYTFFAPLLAMNPHFATTIRQEFGRQLFHPLFHALLLPAPDVRKYIYDVHQRLKDKYVIGIQVRREQGFIRSEESEQQFYRCASILDPYQNATYLLVTDSMHSRHHAVSFLGEDRVVIPFNDFKVKPDPQRRRQIPLHQLKEEMKLTVAEMWLLSQSDDMITTAYSTFGYVASGIRYSNINSVPATVAYVDSNLRSGMTCIRPISNQPICHKCIERSELITKSKCFNQEMELELAYALSDEKVFHLHKLWHLAYTTAKQSVFDMKRNPTPVIYLFSFSLLASFIIFLVFIFVRRKIHKRNHKLHHT